VSPQPSSVFPYDAGIYWDEDDHVYKWSVSFDDQARNGRGREPTFPDAWRGMMNAVLGAAAL
jgi:hypothetical protein